MINKIYEKNMKLLKKLNPYLCDKISNLKISTIEKIITKNHSKNIIKKLQNKKLIIHSQYNPQNQAQFIAKNTFKSDSDIVFLFGLGLGYELKKMIELNGDVRYFIVEPDEEIFKMLLQNYDIKFLFSNMNIHFILGKNAEDIGSFYESVIGYEKSAKIKFVVLPSYQIIYKDLIHKIFLNIKEKINTVKVNIATLTVSHRQWFQNYTGNLKYLNSICPVTELKKELQGKPVVIVSAGPSLDYNIDILKKIQGKVLIAAAGSGISILESKGIKADIVSLIDGWEAESNLIKNIKLNRNTSLFCSSMLYYKIINEFKGPKFLLNVNTMDEKIYHTMDEPHFNMFSGPSVANALAYNLSQLGCNPVIFLGQDLCYSSQKNYAEGATYAKDMSEELKEKSYIKLKNKNNEDVYTTAPFLAMKSSMEDCIRMHPNITYLNGTLNGLSIKGSEDINFNNYANEKFIYKHDIKLKEVYNKFIDNNSKIKKLISMRQSLEKENFTLIDLCKNAIQYIESETNEEKNNKFIKNTYKELNKITLYMDIMNPIFDNLEFIYKNKNYIEKSKQIFSYILDKCLIIDNAFTYIVKGGN